ARSSTPTHSPLPPPARLETLGATHSPVRDFSARIFRFRVRSLYRPRTRNAAPLFVPISTTHSITPISVSPKRSSTSMSRAARFLARRFTDARKRFPASRFSRRSMKPRARSNFFSASNSDGLLLLVHGANGSERAVRAANSQPVDVHIGIVFHYA